MEDGLSCFFARIHDEAEAIFFQTGFFRDLLHNKEEVGEVFVVLFVESQNVVDMFLGMTRIWTGAQGSISLNANQLSSS